MSDKAEKISFDFTQPARGTFLDQVMTPKAFQAGAKTKYKATVLLAADSPDFAKIKEITANIAKSHVPGVKFAVGRRLTQEEVDAGNVREIQVPWKSGDKYADELKAKGKNYGESARGHVIFTASSEFETVLSAVVNGKIEDFTGDRRPQASKYFYNGAYVFLGVAFNYWPGDTKNPPAISCYLENACFAKNGEKLGGQGKSGAERFRGYVGQETAEDPTASSESF